MNGYTKLFNSILASSIWTEDDQTRIVWITLLAMADKHGEVHASIPGVARLAGVPIAATETALGKFLAPDPYSRTPDNEGRRLLPMEGGWRIANHAKYRAMASREDEKAKTAARVAAHRDRKASGTTVTDRYKALQTVTEALPGGVGNGVVTQSLHIAEAEAEADTENTPIPPSPEEQPLKLEAEPTPKPDPIAGFALFWQAYPRKTGRAPAEKAWLKLKPDDDLVRRIVEHVQARRSHPDWTKDAGQFIPHPSTFLNQRRWEDELTASQGEAAGGRALSHEERLLAKAGVFL